MTVKSPIDVPVVCTLASTLLPFVNFDTADLLSIFFPASRFYAGRLFR